MVWTPYDDDTRRCWRCGDEIDGHRQTPVCDGCTDARSRRVTGRERAAVMEAQRRVRRSSEPPRPRIRSPRERRNDHRAREQRRRDITQAAYEDAVTPPWVDGPRPELTKEDR